MRFQSTRGGETSISSPRAIINGIAKDGGLYVPENFPQLYNNLKGNLNISYEELAYNVISKYFNEFNESDLKDAIDVAYNDRFKVEVKNNFLELYHGPTCAFKDAALLFLPQIMKKSINILGLKDEITILTATSGDTGKAALEGFSKVDGFNVVVYYPKDGVSPIQERQMVTQEGKNVLVVGIDGNFDDAQRGVKAIFSDNSFKDKLAKDSKILSSANSINIGRLVPQIVYYFYGYFKLVNQGEIELDSEINVAVPTGNFGNILAAYYAKRMGLPIKKFICASNDNNVLTDFFNSGNYNRLRDLRITTSPSMDILVSSNLERLLFEACNRDTEKVKELMESLNSNGAYDINDEVKNFMKEFYGDFANEIEVQSKIKEVYKESNYLMDTHTAVAKVVVDKYQEKNKDNTPVLIASTASPYKFPVAICNALELDINGVDDFEILNVLNRATGVKIPNSLRELSGKEILQDGKCEVNEMKKVLENFLYEGKND